MKKITKNVSKNYIWNFFSNVKGALVKYLVLKVCYCITSYCNKTFKHYKKRIQQPQHINEHYKLFKKVDQSFETDLFLKFEQGLNLSFASIRS